MVPLANTAPLPHGGDLGAARLKFPDAPEPFIDLSTGINPHPYPLPPLPPETFARLPQTAALERLLKIAAEHYGAPSPEHVVAAPGMQMLLPHVAGLVAAGHAAVLGPTYAEHGRAAVLAGHAVAEVSAVAPLSDADLAIVVNPNNPDGRILARDALIALADRLRGHGGLLVVDEAFMDVGPSDASLGQEVARGNIVVLRSFGKFFGLAGVRLGFALAAPEIATHLKLALGPWAVSGPAIAIGAAALTDRAWASAARAALAEAALKLDALLRGAGLDVIGGTSLFRLAATEAAPALFDRLGRAGILVRRFAERPAWLRVGLPATAEAWARLAAALRDRQ